MMKRYSVPFCAVLFGVLCAVLDWRCQLNGFLPMLAVPMAICFAILAVCARDYATHDNWRFEEYFAGDDTMLKLLSVVGGLLLALGGIGTIALTATADELTLSALPQFVLGLLAIAACASCVVLAKVQARGEMDESSAASTLILLVWATMHLIVLFKGNNTNPYMVTYLSGLLAAVSLTLAFLFYARFLYSKMMPRVFLLFAGAAVLAAFAAAGGAALTALLPGEATGSTNMLHFTYHISALGGAVYLTGQMIRMCAPRRQTYFWKD